MADPITVENSHGKPRINIRLRNAPPLAVPAENDDHDATTGKFKAGNAAGRRRALKKHAKGIATLNPAECEAWVRPHVEHAIGHAMVLAERYPDAALEPLIGFTADSAAVARAFLALAAKGDRKAFDDAERWIKRYSACSLQLSTQGASVIDHALEAARSDKYRAESELYTMRMQLGQAEHQREQAERKLAQQNGPSAQENM